MDYSVFAIILGIPGAEGKIPLVHDLRVPLPVSYKLPGGTFKRGETPEITLYREIQEELGINIYKLREVYQEDKGGYFFIVFEGYYFSGDIFPRDVENIIFCNPRKIKNMSASGLILPSHKDALWFYKNSQKTPID